MLKGVNKRVIIIKNPESEIFEEAYFILKSKNIKNIFRQSKDNEMVTEANRIISDYHNQQRNIIEKNNISGKSGGDMPDLDNFLNINTKKPEKIKDKGFNYSMSDLSDEEIFEDEKFFDNIQNNTGKYNNFYKTPEYINYSEENKKYKPAFNFISSRRIRLGGFPIPPKSFFIGIGFMSAVIILIRLIEFVVLR